MADVRWLVRAYTVSTLGTMLALDAFPLIAIVLLHASAAQVSALAAVGAVAALMAVPLGPWVEFRRKRPVLVGADLLRCAVLVSVVTSAVAGVLSYAHLVAAAMAVAVTAMAAGAASGAHLRALVPPAELATVSGRFEQVTWMSTAVGPPLGGALVGLLGPAVTAALRRRQLPALGRLPAGDPHTRAGSSGAGAGQPARRPGARLARASARIPSCGRCSPTTPWSRR